MLRGALLGSGMIRIERHTANWERQRTIGQFRLFGVSYFAVIAITGYTLLPRWHNTRVVSSVCIAAERARQTGEDDMGATFLGSLPVPDVLPSWGAVYAPLPTWPCLPRAGVPLQ